MKILYFFLIYSIYIMDQEKLIKNIKFWNWQTYRDDHTDLNGKSQNFLLKHVLNHGIKENRNITMDGKNIISKKTIKKNFGLLLPNNFEWKDYISLHGDLKDMEENDAKCHYILHGNYEGRKYSLYKIINKNNFINISSSKSLIENNLYIISFLNINYIDIFEVWYKFYQKLNINKKLIICCLDNESYSYFESKNFNDVIPIKNVLPSNSFELLWILRCETFHYLVTKLNISLLHTDFDCIWFQNLFLYDFNESNLKKYDVISSVGTIFPKAMSQANYFVLCMGLIYFNNSINSKDLLNKIRKDVYESKDDQVSINMICKNFKFNYPENYYNSNHNNIIYREYKECVYSTNPYKILVLPHNRYLRNQNSNYFNFCDLITYHPLLKKTKEDKLSILNYENLNRQISTAEFNTYIISLTDSVRYIDLYNNLKKLKDNFLIKRFNAFDASILPDTQDDISIFLKKNYDININFIDYTLKYNSTIKVLNDKQHMENCKGAYGIYMSNYQIWKEIIDKDISYLLILEDDAKFDYDELEIDKLVKEHHDKDIIWLSEYFWEIDRAGIEAYILFNSGARKLLNVKDIDNAIDRKIVRLCKENYLKYYINNRRFYQNKEYMRTLISYNNLFVTNLYNESEIDRKRELLFSLEYNLKNICNKDDAYLIFYDPSGRDEILLEINEIIKKYIVRQNIKIINYEGRLPYEYLFNYIKAINFKKCYLFNGDLIFPNTEINLKDNQVVSLTIYDVINKTDNIKSYVNNFNLNNNIDKPDLFNENNIKTRGIKGYSTDVWIFNKKFIYEKDFDMKDICLGTICCDGYLNNKLVNSKIFNCYNPCIDYKCLHISEILTSSKIENEDNQKLIDNRKEYERKMKLIGFYNEGIRFSNLKFLNIDYKNIKNNYEIVVTGIRRSGNHVLINWLITKFNECFYLNDIDPFKNLFYPEKIHPEKIHLDNINKDHYKGSYKFIHKLHRDVKEVDEVSKKLIDENQYFEKLYSDKDLLLHTYEDRSLNELRYFDKYNYYGNSKNKFVLVILRNFEDLYISRKCQIENEWLQDITYHGTNMSDPKHKILNLWNQYINYYNKNKQIFNNYNTIYVIYEKFINDLTYRNEIAKMLNLSNINDNLLTTNFGGGSSYNSNNKKSIKNKLHKKYVENNLDIKKAINKYKYKK